MAEETKEKMTAQQWKDQGNAHVSAAKWDDAVEAYTNALDGGHPDRHACYGNRSMVHLKLGNTMSAVADANCAIDAKPGWWKGYSRLGAALQQRKDWDGADNAYTSGLEKVQDSTGKRKLTEGLADCKARRGGGSTAASAAATNTNRWQTIQSYLRWFIIMNAIIYLIPSFILPIPVDGFRSVLLGCFFKYAITLSYHGRPSMTAEYGKFLTDVGRLLFLFMSNDTNNLFLYLLLLTSQKTSR
jgi:tetratricopeptide (TPR) repeat protein